MNNKNIFISFFIIVLVIMGVFYLYNSNTQGVKSDEKVVNNGVLPPLFMGDVVSVDSNQIIIKTGTGEFAVSILDSTILVQQVKDGEGFKNMPATTSDIGIGKRVVIFYKAVAESQYSADKIQVLNF